MLLYTDGIADAIDRRDEGFGVLRLRQALVQASGAPVEGVVAAIDRALQAHAGELERFDGVTMIAIQRVADRVPESR